MYHVVNCHWTHWSQFAERLILSIVNIRLPLAMMYKRSNHDQQSSFELNNAHEFRSNLLGISLLHHVLHLINPKYLVHEEVIKQMRLNELMSNHGLPCLIVSRINSFSRFLYEHQGRFASSRTFHSSVHHKVNCFFGMVFILRYKLSQYPLRFGRPSGKTLNTNKHILCVSSWFSLKSWKNLD